MQPSEGEVQTPTRPASIPTVIVSEPATPEGMPEDKEEKLHTETNGSVTPRFDTDGDSIGDSVDQSQVMNQDFDYYSTLSLNMLNEQGTALANEYMPSAPDGGYGWIIVLAAFYCNLVVDGVCNAFSEFKGPFGEYFGSSETTTALIGSILIATYLLVGPIVGGILNKFGARVTVISGAVITSLSFVIATFMTNIILFIFFFSVCGGLGFGMIYLPAIICVGQYFEKKRAVATGISVAGSGVGTIIMPILIEYVVGKYNWCVAVYVNSALAMTCALVGILYKPLVVEPVNAKPRGDVEMEMMKKKLQQYDDDEEDVGEDEENEPPSRGGSHATRTSEWIDRSNKVLAEDAGIDDAVMARLRSALSECENDGDSEANGTGQNTGNVSPVPPKPLSPINENNASFKQRSATTQNPPVTSLSTRNRKLTITSVNSDMLSNADLKSQASTRNLGVGLSRISARSIGQSMSKLSQRGVSTLSIAMTGVDPQEFAKPMNRKDIFYAGSIRNLKEFNDEGKNIQNYRESVLSIPTSVISRAASKLSLANGDLADVGTRMGGSRMSRLTGGPGQEEEVDYIENYYDDRGCKFLPLAMRNAMFEMLDIDLLKDHVMILLCLSNLLGMMGFYIPFMYLKSLGLSNGVPSSEARYLVPIIGITNTFGRIFFGWFADRNFYTALSINNFALITCGLLSIVCPFFPSLIGLSIYSALFGFIISAYICLTSIVLADLLGLDKLTNSFGILVVARGVASLFGSPFAGLVYDMTKSYAASFYFAGGIIVFSGLLSCLIPFFHRRKRSHGDNEGDIGKDEDAMSGKLSVLTERSEENLTEYQRTIQSLRQQHALLREMEDEKARIAGLDNKAEPIGEAENEAEEETVHTSLLRPQTRNTAE